MHAPPRPGWCLAAEVAVRDALHEWRLSAFAAMGLAAVLAPLLVLLGLKVGLVASLTDRLVSDPSIRAIQVVGQGSFGPAFFTEAAARPDVGFIIPNTRFLASAGYLGETGQEAEVELLPSASGDPLLAGAGAPGGLGEVLLSSDLAAKLGLTPGDSVPLRVTRGGDQGLEEAVAMLRMTGTIPPALLPRDSALVALPLLQAVEDWRTGYAVPELGWPGTAAVPPGVRTYPSFRIYAKDIHAVAGLRDWLAGFDLDLRTRLSDIQLVSDIDRALTTIFAMLAAVASAGQSVALVLGHAATVARKRRELAALRLMGLRGGHLAVFPVVQAALTAIAGGLAAALAFAGVSALINQRFADLLGSASPPCHLPAGMVAAAILLTALLSVAASAWSCLRAVWVDATEVLREE